MKKIKNIILTVLMVVCPMSSQAFAGETLRPEAFSQRNRPGDAQLAAQVEDIFDRLRAKIAAGTSDDKKSYYMLIDEAAESLAKLGPGAVPYIGEALVEAHRATYTDTLYGDTFIIPVSIEALGLIKDPAGIPYLCETAKGFGYFIESVEAMDAIGFEHIDDTDTFLKIVSGVADKDPLNQKAWRQFERLGARTVPRLAELLDSSYPRKIVIRALGRTKTPEAVTYLAKDAQDRDYARRADAVEALGENGKPEALPYLLSALKDDRYSVKNAAIQALGKIKDPAAISSLEPLLDIQDGHRMDAADAICAIGLDSVSADTLIKLAVYADLGKPRESAFKALSARGESALNSIFLAGDSPNEYLRLAAATALGNTASAKVVDYLGDMAEKDSANIVREAAICALGRIRNPAAIKFIIRGLHDDEANVRIEAADTLAGIGINAVSDLDLNGLIMAAAYTTNDSARQSMERRVAKAGESAIPFISKTLASGPSGIQTVAIDILALMDIDIARPVLCAALTSPDQYIADKAEETLLLKIPGAAENIKPLKAMLQEARNKLETIYEGAAQMHEIIASLGSGAKSGDRREVRSHWEKAWIIFHDAAARLVRAGRTEEELEIRERMLKLAEMYPDEAGKPLHDGVSSDDLSKLRANRGEYLWSAYGNLARLYKQLGRMTDYESALKQQISLVPHRASAYYELVRLLEEQKRYQEALDLLTAAQRDYPWSLQARIAALEQGAKALKISLDKI